MLLFADDLDLEAVAVEGPRERRRAGRPEAVPPQLERAEALLLVPRAAGEGFRDCLCPARADAVRAEVEGPQALGMMKI